MCFISTRKVPLLIDKALAVASQLVSTAGVLLQALGSSIKTSRRLALNEYERVFDFVGAASKALVRLVSTDCWIKRQMLAAKALPFE